jgi:hypothetical protein
VSPARAYWVIKYFRESFCFTDKLSPKKSIEIKKIVITLFLAGKSYILYYLLRGVSLALS